MSTATAPRTSRTAEAIAAATPADRDRYADLLRVLALGVVIVGHWLQAVLLDDGAGGTRVTTLLEEVPAVRPLTWVLQVMPVFFLVGGFTNAASWASATRRGEPWNRWMAVRAARLLRPALVLLAVWAVFAGALLAGGMDAAILRTALISVVLPLWFLVVHLGLTAVTPLSSRFAARLGWGAPALLTAAAMVVDALAAGKLGVELSLIGYANFAFVWLAVATLGHLWHQGRLHLTPRAAAPLLLVGAGGLLLLVGVAGYPTTMVTVDAATRSNSFPPTAALVALGLVQAGVAAALRPAAERALSAPRAWTAVALAGSVSMTAYLWHLTAMLLVAGGVLLTGSPHRAVDGSWWATRPLWIALCAAVLVALLAVFRRYERGPARPPSSTATVAVGTALAVAGLAAVILGGVLPDAPVWVALAGLLSLAVGAGALGVRIGVRRGLKTPPPLSAPLR